MTVHPLVAELEATRLRLGLPEETIAEATGAAADEVTWWGTGLRTPTLKQAVQYAAVLGSRLGFAGPGGEVEHVDDPPGDDTDDPAGRLMAVLDERRDRLGIPRRQVAADIGVSPATVGRWSNGDKPPSLTGLVGYAAAVRWSVVLVAAADLPFQEEPPTRPAGDHPAGRPRSSAKHRVLHPLVAEVEQTRIESGVSQAELARATGVHVNTAGRWSTGIKTPSVENLVDAARALGREVFIGRSADGPVPPPEMVRRRRLLQEIDLARGNRDQRTKRVPSYDDGTGPQWADVAAEALTEEIQADCVNQLTWAVKTQAALAQALTRDDPADLRAELLTAAATLVAWLEDLDARGDGQAGDGQELEGGDG